MYIAELLLAIVLIMVYAFCFILSFYGYFYAIVITIVTPIAFGIVFGAQKIKEIKHIEKLAKEKEEKFAEFKAQGFSSTRQYKVSSQLFAVDQNSRQWFVMKYSDPKSAKLHTFDEIRGYERKENAQTQSVGLGSVFGYGIGLGTVASQKVYTKLGVMVSIADINNPTEFISCMGNEDGVDEVLSILDTITGK